MKLELVLLQHEAKALSCSSWWWRRLRHVLGIWALNSHVSNGLELTTSRRLCCCVCSPHEKWRAIDGTFCSVSISSWEISFTRFVAEQHSRPPNLAPPLLVFSVEVQDDIPYVSVGSSTNCVFGGVPSIPCDDGRDVVDGTISW